MSQNQRIPYRVPVSRETGSNIMSQRFSGMNNTSQSAMQSAVLSQRTEPIIDQ